MSLIDIQDRITRESASYLTARNFTGSLHRQCTKLASLPGMLGRPRPEWRHDLRSFAFKGYVIVFRYSDDRLEVVDILEGHRDIDARFRDDT